MRSCSQQAWSGALSGELAVSRRGAGACECVRACARACPGRAREAAHAATAAPPGGRLHAARPPSPQLFVLVQPLASVRAHGSTRTRAGRPLLLARLPPLPRFRRSPAQLGTWVLPWLSPDWSMSPAPTRRPRQPSATWQAAVTCQRPRHRAAPCLLETWEPGTRQSPCRGPQKPSACLSDCPGWKKSVSSADPDEQR